ncbi:MAG TPA: hypothetical protein VMR06_17915 [Dokdonella sp.]|uniref:hypothetical protein n=1 Tax=Dokdonella sp. TaxID=2291710 RepID=UPI002CE03D40|nr:hypothetical protein [Dokdonella sp.]HUD43866.1 hypothetical protein [Dokdonella sp.]
MLALLLPPLLASAFARAAEPPMPAEADVAAAVAAAIDGRPVCETTVWLPLDEDGKASLASDHFVRRRPGTDARIDALAKIGLVTSATIEESDGPKRVIELTARGREYIRRESIAWRLCYAKRKLDRIEVYTPPVEREGYWIVRAVYTWRPSQIEPWSRELFALGALGSDGRAVDGERRDWIVLVSTNRGWKDQAWFGNPIK